MALTNPANVLRRTTRARVPRAECTDKYTFTFTWHRLMTLGRAMHTLQASMRSSSLSMYDSSEVWCSRWDSMS